MEPIISPVREKTLFRPNKKRKTYRQRGFDDVTSSKSPSGQDETSNPLSAPAATDGDLSDSDETEGANVPISEILRLRKLRKQRIGGVEFRPASMAERSEDTQDGALVLHGRADGERAKVPVEIGGIRRFAKQTGMVGDVDKHMIAYIDSELAKRHLYVPSPVTDTRSATESSPRKETLPDGAVHPSSKPAERQPATLGKLLEIDLGNEARDKNVVRTEQARRRLGGEIIEDESTPERKSKKVRLGRDGKPWRERKGRSSDDIKRDKLVEELLHENRLELYEEPIPPLLPPSSGDAEDDGEADDRIAEAFRREFMDAVSQRQRKKANPATSTARGAAGKKEEEVLKGPKLGGSRSARAAMREAQLKEMKTARK